MTNISAGGFTGIFRIFVVGLVPLLCRSSIGEVNCSDCTILGLFSGLLGRLRLPACLPFSKPKVNWLLHPVMVLFLSSHSFGTIITYPHIRSERLLLILTFARND